MKRFKHIADALDELAKEVVDKADGYPGHGFELMSEAHRMISVAHRLRGIHYVYACEDDE